MQNEGVDTGYDLERVSRSPHWVRSGSIIVLK